MFVQEAFPAITQKHPTTARSLQQFLFTILQSVNTVRKITQIHTQIIINAYTQRNFIIVKLLQSYLSSGYLQHAHQAFKQINNPSTTSWNQIIRGYAGSDNPRKSVHLFDEMLASGEIPDEYTYSYVISACARGKLLQSGEKLHGKVLAGGFCSNLFVQTNLLNLYAVAGEGDSGGPKNAQKVFNEMGERNMITWNTLLNGYVKCGDINGAHKLFDQMPEKNIVSYTTLISGYTRNGGCKEALSLLREMLKAHMELDQATLVTGLSACAEIGDLKMGRWIHSYITRSLHINNNNNKHTVRLNNALLHMYAGCGAIKDAYKVFDKMPSRTIVSWTTMIQGFAKQGHGEQALSVFHSMKDDHNSQPDAITLLAVLHACSHSGFVEQGRDIFKNMKPIWGIEPTIEHYGCMVDILSRAGCLQEAYKLVESMPMDPNDAIWGALLGGCRIHKNVELAFKIGKKIGDLRLEDDKVVDYLVLLSNVYAGGNRWKDVGEVREYMVRVGVKKAPGRSWVEIGGCVDEFMAGDMSHKDVCLIYEMLYLVTIEAGLNEYKPDVYNNIF